MTLDLFNDCTLPLYRESRTRRKGGDSDLVSVYRCDDPSEIVWVSGIHWTHPDEYEWHKISRERDGFLDKGDYAQEMMKEKYDEAPPDFFWAAVESVLGISPNREDGVQATSIVDDITSRVNSVSGKS